jgi:hypothetical protein
MREFLHSEIAAIHGVSNLPERPDLAIAVGQQLCSQLLEPLQATFGRVSIRSGYRSPLVNALGNQRYGSCASNEADRGRHIWDQRSANGGAGAMATIVIPWLLEHVAAGGAWTSMAWWIHDHLPYSELQFFPRLSAFNIGWHETPVRRITSFAAPRGLLTKAGMANHEGKHTAEYLGFPRPKVKPNSAGTTRVR